MANLIAYSLPNILISFYTLGLGCFVLVSNPKLTKNRIWFLLSCAIFLWLFSYGVGIATDQRGRAYILMKMGHAAAVCITPLTYLFIIKILGNYSKRIDYYMAQFAVLYALLSIFLLYKAPSYMPGIIRHSWGYYPLGGPLMIAYASWTFGIALRVLILLSRASTRARKDLDDKNYQRFKYYAISVGIFVFSSVDYLPKFQIPIYPLGFLFVAAFTSVTTYAIVRHKLLDIDLIIRKGFIYSVLISALFFIYLTIIFISESIFRSYLGYKSIFMAITMSSLIAIGFNPLRLYIQKTIDKLFYKATPEKIIEENNRLKEIVQQQDHLKAVATLAAGMAHEIKNPLTSIKTFAEFLPEKYEDAEFRNKFKRIVTDEVGRVNNIVKQILEFSKPQEPNLQECRLTDILNETLELLNNSFLDHQIEVTKKYLSNPTVRVDRNQLKQAFLNIFLNSIEAMPNGGTLKVIISPHKGNQILIEVIDNGYGIDTGHLSQVFDPFFTMTPNGTGLGLSIVHGIITKHGGEIKIESEKGIETSVSIILKTS